MPSRIQRKRTRGWKLPPGAIYVGRPSRWGNDFEIGIDGTAEDCVRLHTEALNMLRENSPTYFRFLVAPLRDKDLACWCRLDQPCHADTLLRIANED